MHERARKMMQQQRDDEAKNSSCLLVLSLSLVSESESALSLGIWCCSCQSSLILIPTISICNPTLFNLHFGELNMRERLCGCTREGVRMDERTRAREMMQQQQQRDDEAKNSSCLLVLSLVCESESALSLGIWCSCCLLVTLVPPSVNRDMY